MDPIKYEVNELKNIIKRIFGVDILQNTRKRDYVNARMVYAKLLRERNHTFESIAKSIGKDHATIIYYVKVVPSIFKQDRFLERKYIECKKFFFGRLNPELEPTTEEVLSEKVRLLYEEIERLSNENNVLTLNYEHRVTRLDRINKIINLIEERTHYGKEELIEKKIREMFNGLPQ